MKVLVAHKILSATHFYRMFLPLATMGAEVVVMEVDEFEDGQQGYNLSKYGDADIFFCSMPSSREWVEAMVAFKERGIKVVVDYDDYVPGVPEGHRSKPGAEMRAPWLLEASKQADLVITSTPFLRKKYGGTVIRNCVPGKFMNALTRARDNSVLWYGSLDIHVGDFKECSVAIEKLLLNNKGVYFRHMGDGDITEYFESEGLKVKSEGHLAFEDCLQAIPSSRYGIVPLKDNDLNRAKSWLKGLEMAAMGIPFVASPTPEYIALSVKGAGKVAHTQREWFRELMMLTTNEDYFQTNRARAIEAAKTLTIENNVERWVDAFKTIL